MCCRILTQHRGGDAVMRDGSAEGLCKEVSGQWLGDVLSVIHVCYQEVHDEDESAMPRAGQSSLDSITISRDRYFLLLNVAPRRSTPRPFITSQAHTYKSHAKKGRNSPPVRINIVPSK